MTSPKFTPPPAGIPHQILCSATASDRPEGVGILDALTYQHEKQTGRKSQLPAHIIEKLEAHARLAELRSETRSVMASARPQASPAVMAKPTALYDYIRSGKISAATTESDLRDMLKLARDLILSYRETTSPAPAPDGTISAEQFQGPPPPKMFRSEFHKMSDADRSKFIREGGRLVADPKAPRR